MLRIGADPDQPGDLAVGTGLFLRLPDGRLRHRFTQVDRVPGHRPVPIIERRMSKTSSSAFVTATLTDGTRLSASGAAGSS